MYKTAITLPEKIRSKSVAALLAGLVALTALSITPLTASAGTPLPEGNDFRLRGRDQEGAVRQPPRRVVATHCDSKTNCCRGPQASGCGGGRL